MTSREFKERLHKRARKAGLTLRTELIWKLESYLRLLALWNVKINLTALPLDDPTDETIDRLVIEPLVAARTLSDEPLNIIDIGSGGGSPAIPLTLALPAVSMTMVEAKTRKSAFLREAIRHLGLSRARVETARFEELLARPDLHEAMDVVTLRAVRVEQRTLLTLQAFLRPTGQLLLFRGRGGRDDAPPPLQFKSSTPLLDNAGSRLVVFEKLGMFHVEHPAGRRA